MPYSGNYKNTDMKTHPRHRHSKVVHEFLKPDFLVTLQTEV